MDDLCKLGVACTLALSSSLMVQRQKSVCVGCRDAREQYGVQRSNTQPHEHIIYTGGARGPGWIMPGGQGGKTRETKTDSDTAREKAPPRNALRTQTPRCLESARASRVTPGGASLPC